MSNLLYLTHITNLEFLDSILTQGLKTKPYFDRLTEDTMYYLWFDVFGGICGCLVVGLLSRKKNGLHDH